MGGRYARPAQTARHTRPRNGRPSVLRVECEGESRAARSARIGAAQGSPMTTIERSTWATKVGLARMLAGGVIMDVVTADQADRKSTRLNSSHLVISYAVF